MLVFQQFIRHLMSKKIMIVMPISSIDGRRSVGGVDSACQLQVEGLRKSNCKINQYTIVGFNPANDLTNEREEHKLSANITLNWYNYNNISRNRVSIFPSVLKNEMVVRSSILSIRPDIVHSHLPCWHVRKYMAEKKILTLHQYKNIGRTTVGRVNDLVHRDIIEPISISRADVLTSVSVEVMQMIKKSHGVETLYIPNPIADRYFEVKRQPENTGELNLFMSGIISRGKRVQDALEVIRRLKPKYPHIRLTLAGRFGADTAFQKYLFDFVEAHDLNRNIHFAGLLDQDEMLKYLQNAHIALFLSEAETFGLAPLECLAAGVPLITTEVGVFKWRRYDFQSRGVEIIRVGDINACVQAVSRHIQYQMYAAPDHLRQFVAKQFSLRSCTDLYIRCYGAL